MAIFKNVSLSKDQWRAVNKGLTALARENLKRMQRDAAKAETLGDARSRQRTTDVQRRHTLNAALANAEANFRHEHHRIGHTSDWREKWREHYQEAVDEARAELADFDAERSKPAETVAEGGLFAKCEAFLVKNRDAIFRECVAPLPAKATIESLNKLRDEIETLEEAIENVNLAPLTLPEAMTVIDRSIEKLAKSGAPDLFGPTRFAIEYGDKRAQGHVIWPEQTIVTGKAIHKLPDGFGMLFWAFKDLIRDKLEAECRARIESSKFAPISATDRDARKAELSAQLLAAERVEETIVAHLQAKGDSRAVRRGDANPLALLGIEIVGKIEEKRSGPGSLAEGFYNPPMEKPADQKLPRSSEWVSKGPRNSDVAKD